MAFFENIKIAFMSIAANKMRSLLTMLGIIIGISAVITITTIGSCIEATLKNTINDLGGVIMGAYPADTDRDLMARVLKDNPLGQSHEQTPMGIIREIK